MAERRRAMKTDTLLDNVTATDKQPIRAILHDRAVEWVMKLLHVVLRQIHKRLDRRPIKNEMSEFKLWLCGTRKCPHCESRKAVEWQTILTLPDVKTRHRFFCNNCCCEF